MFFLCLFVKSSCRFALGKIVGHMRTQTHVAEQASYMCMIDFVCSLFVHLFLSPLSLFLSLSLNFPPRTSFHHNHLVYCVHRLHHDDPTHERDDDDGVHCSRRRLEQERERERERRREGGREGGLHKGKGMGKHGTRGHKQSTKFSTPASGGLGYTLNKELKKQYSGANVMQGGASGVSARHSASEDATNLQSVTEVTDLEALMQRASSLANGVQPDAYRLVTTDAAGARNDSARHGSDDDDDDDDDENDVDCSGKAKEREENDTDDDEENISDVLRLPRRPPWTREMTAAELDAREQASFLEWRRRLAVVEERYRNGASSSSSSSSRRNKTNNGIGTGGAAMLTPFEKNLQVWRQLWRVLERSDLVVQIVDARDPLMYRCEDLEEYVREHAARGAKKRSFLLLNKADMLPFTLRSAWAAYFRERGVNFAFWSAKAASEEEEEEDEEHRKDDDDDDDDDQKEEKKEKQKEEKEEDKQAEEEIPSAMSLESMQKRVSTFEPERLLTRDELLMVLEVEATLTATDGGRLPDLRTMPGNAQRVVVGLVGYPNVGKSSTINALIGTKKTMVSATPGKTKHFQTLIVSDTLMLCDCPGLVFPSIGGSKAEMVAAGVLPVDRLTDVRSPVGVIAARVTRRQIEAVYNISLPKPKLHEPQDRPATGAEFIISLALGRSMIAAGGAPDQTRTGRLIIKDFINGKLVHFTVPPGSDDALSFDKLWTEVATNSGLLERVKARGGGAVANGAQASGGGARRDVPLETSLGGSGRREAVDDEERAEGGVLARQIIAEHTAGRIQAQAFSGPSQMKRSGSGIGGNQSGDTGTDRKPGKRASHKFHNKANRRNQPKTAATGYGYYDRYE